MYADKGQLHETMNALKCKTLGATRERTFENARAIEMREC